MNELTRSVIIGRKKRSEGYYPCFVHFFNIDDPHKTGKVPEKMLEFDKVHKVIIEGLDINYLLEGNDIVINWLESVSIEEKGPHLYISGKQTKARE